MVTPKENMTNLCDTESLFTVGDSGKLTVTKCGDWHVHHKHDRKLHRAKLSDMSIILGRHANLFIITQSLQKGFQVVSEGEALILKKNSTEIRFDKKIVNNGGEGFILTTKFYNSPNDAALLVPKKQNPEGKADVQLEGTAVKKQDKITTKKQETRKIYAKELHLKLGYPGEERMYATANHVHYSVNGMLEV